MSAPTPLPTTSPKSILQQLKAESSEVLQLLRSVGQSQKTATNRVENAQFGQAEYMKRLRTFDKFQAQWITLSRYVSPISFASHGWYVHDRGYVKCGTCNALISVKLSTSSPGPSLKHVAKYIVGKLRSGHDIKCIWSSHVANQLPEENFTIKSILPIVKATFEKYPNIEILPSESVFHESHKDYLESSLLAHSDSPAALLVASHAWVPNDAQTSVQCRLCAATVNLQHYNMPGAFDPVKFHRVYCPVRVNTKCFQEGVFLSNGDDLTENPSIVENLRCLQSFLDHSGREDADDASFASNASSPSVATEQP
uniref:C3HC-type domain-containing protein n=1 Tax=Panagrellus redivivus TaxID=6233 RepID=A0A7E4V5L8_PANRE